MCDDAACRRHGRRRHAARREAGGDKGAPMKIELNGEKAPFTARPDATLKDVLTQLRAHCSQRGQVVSELTLDGTALTLATEPEFGERRAREFKLLRARSVPVERIVRSIIKGLLEALDNLKAKSVAIGALVKQGRRTDAFAHLGAFTSDLAFFSDGIHHCCTCLGAGKPDVEALVREGLADLKDMLARLKSGIPATEVDRFTDLLSIELPESLERWRPFLKTAAELTTAPGPAENPGLN
ncbi:MAG TPA: hypothetical protein DCM87_02105 [Planctomycetes bacterium]|nr:hypothetical protein [Planctomycetota bacterium]